jgi:hypothetical protein
MFQVNCIVFHPLVEEVVVTLRNVKLDKEIIIDCRSLRIFKSVIPSNSKIVKEDIAK